MASPLLTQPGLHGVNDVGETLHAQGVAGSGGVKAGRDSQHCVVEDLGPGRKSRAHQSGPGRGSGSRHPTASGLTHL